MLKQHLCPCELQRWDTSPSLVLPGKEDTKFPSEKQVGTQVVPPATGKLKMFLSTLSQCSEGTKKADCFILHLCAVLSVQGVNRGAAPSHINIPVLHGYDISRMHF